MTEQNLDRIEALIRQLLDVVASERAGMAAARPVLPPPAPEQAVDPIALAFSDYGALYDFLRGNKLLGPKISKSEFDGCDAIIRACVAAGWGVSYTAYALATSYLETANTMQPIKEIGGTAYFMRMYDITGQRPAKAKELGNLTKGDGAKYPGHGYVQLTGKKNYRHAQDELAKIGIVVDLVNNPALAMRPDVAAAIMVLGMQHGWFTGRKLSDDLPAHGPATLIQFVASRDIINGKDRQEDVAAYAFQFQTGLLAGGYRI